MIRIHIEGIKVFAHHGVMPEEKERGQEFLIDVEIELDEGAAQTDDISATIDYAQVAEAVAGMASSKSYDLLETLASEIVDYVLSLEGAKAASVCVRKPQAPLPVEAAWVGVTVSRES